MQLDEKTMDVLKNFASINPNIIFRGEEVLRTISEGKNVVGKATLSSFPERELGFYDLNQFIGTVGLVDGPELDFKDSHVVIGSSSGRSRIKYFYTSPDVLTNLPTKDIKMPSEEVKFTLTEEDLSRLRKAASTLGHTELAIEPSDGALTFSIVDADNSTSNTFSLDIAGEFESTSFRFIFNIANFKMIPGDYEVTLSKKLISHLKHVSEPVEYWIAMEKNSEYS